MRNLFNVVTFDLEHGVRQWGKTTMTPFADQSRPGVELVMDWTSGPVFLCLPTPMKLDGSCDLSILRRVLGDVESWNSTSPTRFLSERRVLIIKSTVPPGSTRHLAKLFHDGIDLIFSPEFLTETNAVEDYAHQKFVILGGVHNDRLWDFHHKAFPDATIHWTPWEVAEMVKYIVNVFLASKVSLANELAQVWERVRLASEIPWMWENVMSVAKCDPRLGDSHWLVPGPDGKRGFGGSCFPKDLNSLIHEAMAHGLDPKVMKAVWEKNLEVRPEKDWEELVGRAVSVGHEDE